MTPMPRGFTTVVAAVVLLLASQAAPTCGLTTPALQVLIAAKVSLINWSSNP
jgi:hypothetical protein